MRKSLILFNLNGGSYLTCQRHGDGGLRSMEAMGSSVAMGGWRRPLIVHGQRAASTALEEDSKEQNSRDKAVALLGG